MSVTRIPVGGERPYEVVVGTGVLGELPALVGKDATSVMVITPDGLDEIARPVCRALADAGYEVRTAQVPAGEAAKDISVAAALWSKLAASRITRSDAIVGVGGGRLPTWPASSRRPGCAVCGWFWSPPRCSR